jgi:hypothetical protein
MALAALVSIQPATAGDWTQFNVSSIRSGQNGTAAKISGVIDDSHGARPARLVVSCIDNELRPAPQRFDRPSRLVHSRKSSSHYAHIFCTGIEPANQASEGCAKFLIFAPKLFGPTARNLRLCVVAVSAHVSNPLVRPGIHDDRQTDVEGRHRLR